MIFKPQNLFYAGKRLRHPDGFFPPSLLQRAGLFSVIYIFLSSISHQAELHMDFLMPLLYGGFVHCHSSCIILHLFLPFLTDLPV